LCSIFANKSSPGAGHELPAGHAPHEAGAQDEQGAAAQYLVLITCKSAKHQEQVLAECQKRGSKCKPLMG